MTTRALITGVCGQDGHYLSELLRAEGTEVYGLERRHTQPQPHPKGVVILDADLTDHASLARVFYDVKPDEVYNLGAQSHVQTSFKNPVYTWNVNAGGALALMELCVKHKARMYQASTSEMFGNTAGPLNEDSTFAPANPYAVAKLAAHHALRIYRKAYGLFGVAGILFNHESPRRSPDFVTQKIATAAARVSLGLPSDLELGNLDAARDWGHARDYVRAMVLMLRQEEPQEYVVATGQTRTVRSFIMECERVIGKPIPYTISKAHQRPSETYQLVADPSRAMKQLGWKPEVPFGVLVREMVEAAKVRVQSQISNPERAA